jgi:cell division protein FtsI (penicillin-binding protein 3)
VPHPRAGRPDQGRPDHGRPDHGRSEQGRPGQARPVRPAGRRPRPTRWARISRGNPGRRLGITLLAIVFVLTLFGGRLVQIQGMESGYYKIQAKDNYLTTISLPAVRGTITGSNGQILAMTVQTYTITADPPQVGDLTTAAQELAGPLGMSAASVLNLLEHPTSPEWVVLAKGVSASNEAKIASMPGISASATYARVYPNGDATANVVGFTNSVNGAITGEQGVEEEYNKLLSGTPGSEEEEMGADGQAIPGTEIKATQAANGSSIQLTINPVLQYQAQEACQKQVEAVRAKNCTIVIIAPKTGNILAMAQWPTYSQTDITNVAATDDLPVEDTFQPGSTAKVITAAAAFEHGGQNPESAYTIPYDGYIEEGGDAIHDAEDDAGAHYTIAGIIAHSSNIGMSEVATHVSDQTQYDYLKNFGLDEPTGLGLPGESDGLLPPVSQWWASEHYTLAFGQGIAVNAVQMASVYATIANDGVRVQPRLVEGVTNAAGKYTPATPSTSRRVIKAKTAKQLISILQQVPPLDASADGNAGVISGYAIAAKTGTSQETGPECKPAGSLCEYGSSFIGMGPGNNPQVVVSVNVQDPDQKIEYYGDIVAGPVFSTVMKDTLAALQIPPQAGLEPPNVPLNAP